MSATPEPPWERVKEALADVLDAAPSARAEALARVTAGEPALRAAVERLLPKDPGASDFLARPAVTLLDVPALHAGERVGNYVLRGVIGEGGMGRVYEAEQERPHRTVALKVMRPGFLSAAVEQRFEWEAEALGRLAHPAIARVLEAGIDETRGGTRVSWFAMERVEGRPLLAAADALGLDRVQRLRLFLRICAGVSHAHQRGVIHRDLKPENVLVDADGDPHIVDFGIARFTDPASTSVTAAGEVIGTLAYMSPEQVLGDPSRVDVRADVYALGVLLYRLLTGAAPLALEGLSLPAVARRLTEDDPVPASRHDRTLRGDLETILATALARDLERRYASVDGLATDILAVLEDRPISARPPTALYHFAKFARRHTGLVVGVAASFVLLVVAVVGTTIGLRRASAATARAEAARSAEREAAETAREALRTAALERDHARATSAFLRQVLQSPDPRELGIDTKVVDLLASAGADLSADKDLEPVVRGTLHTSLGETYRRLDAYSDALQHLTAAVALLEAELPPTAEELLEARAGRAEVLADLLQFEEARAEWQKLRDAVAALTAGRATSELPAWLGMRPLEVELHLADAAGDHERGLALAEQVYQGWLQRGAPGDDAVESARNAWAQALMERGEFGRGVPLLREGHALAEARLGARHPTTVMLRSNLAIALSQIGEHREAEAMLRELVPLTQEVWGERSRMAVTALNNLAQDLSSQARHDDARALQERAVALHMRVFGFDHPETFIARNNLAVSLAQLGQYAEALAQLDTILEGMGRIEGFDDPLMRANVQGSRAAILGNLDRRDEALPALREVFETYVELAGEGHLQTLVVRNNLAMLLMDLGRGDEAVAEAERTVALTEENLPGHPLAVFPFRMNLGRALVAAGRLDEGLAELRRVQQRLADDPDASAAQRARVQEVLTRAEAAPR